MSPVEFKEAEADTFIFEAAGETELKPDVNENKTITNPVSTDNDETIKNYPRQKKQYQKCKSKLLK